MIDWGDVPTWLGASFAALAAGAAVWTLKSQRDQIGEQRDFIAEQSATLSLEREALRAAAEDRKWAQARQVRMAFHEAGDRADSEGNWVEGDHWVVTVVNTSEAPVHDVDVRFGEASRPADVYEALRRSQGWSPGERLVAPVHLLGPGRAAQFSSQTGSASWIHNNRPSAYFRDDSGLRWSLDSHGKLEEAEPPPGA